MALQVRVVGAAPVGGRLLEVCVQHESKVHVSHLTTDAEGTLTLPVFVGSIVSVRFLSVFPPTTRTMIDAEGATAWSVEAATELELQVEGTPLRGARFLQEGRFVRMPYDLSLPGEAHRRGRSSPWLDADELAVRGVVAVAFETDAHGRFLVDLASAEVDEQGDLLVAAPAPGSLVIESRSAAAGEWSASAYSVFQQVGALPGLGVRPTWEGGHWRFAVLPPGEHKIEFWRDDDKWRSRYVLPHAVQVVSGATAYVRHDPLDAPRVRLRVLDWEALGGARRPRLVTLGIATFAIDATNGTAEVRITGDPVGGQAAPRAVFSFGNRVGGLLRDVTAHWHEATNELHVSLDLDRAGCRLGVLPMVGGQVGVEVLQETPMAPSSWTGIGVVADEDGLFRVIDGPEALPVVLYESDPKTQRRHVRGWLDVRGRRGVHWLAPAGRWLALVVGAPLEAEVHVLGPIGVPAPDQVLPSFGLRVQDGVSLWLPNEARGIRVAYSSGSWIDVPAASLGSVFVVPAVGGR